MKQTYETLREWYLRDLQLPDTFHGRETPKVRNLAPWNAIEEEPCHLGEIQFNNIWLWSDNHFGHKNIIKYADGHRPYTSTEEMNQAMIDNCLKVVKPGDALIFGGDVAFMNIHDINNILLRFPGYKIQIVGNHDMDRSGKLTEFIMHERHLCMVHDIPDTEFQLLFTHYPLDSVPPNCVNVHGHIHQNLAKEHNINICVEHTGCAPINIKDVEAR